MECKTQIFQRSVKKWKKKLQKRDVQTHAVTYLAKNSIWERILILIQILKSVNICSVPHK